jgi:lipopolysaccharide export system permease protein
MIFKRAIFNELTSTAGAVFTVLFSIIFSVGLVRILGDAAGGRVDNAAVFQLVALAALTNLPTVLTLTLFVAVLIALSRSFRDSEMVVWFSSGQSLLAWINPVLRFAAPIVVLVAVLAIGVSPWSERLILESRKRYEQRDDVSKVAPGRFVESVDLDGARVHNVFVSHRSQGREGVIVAAQGVIEVRDNGDRFLVLESGRRYEGIPGAAEYRMTEFDRYLLRIDSRPDEPIAEGAARAKTTGGLLAENTPFARAEFLVRISQPIVAVLLALLAVPLAYLNPRVGRSFNLILAVLAFLLYNNGLSVVKAWVQQGRLSFGIGVWLVHAIVLLVVAALFARRVYMQRWIPRWRDLRVWRKEAA